MKLSVIVSGLLASAFFTEPALSEKYRDRTVPMASQANLNLEKYQGLWYEIARFPNRFEKGCQGVTAEYSLLDNGEISVVNTCRVGSLSGKIKSAEGKAKVEGPGRLSVNFVLWLPFARGDYWVLSVDKEYTTAVVGAPKGTTGWILARTPKISNEQRSAAEAVLQKNGYNTQQLLNVDQ